MRKTMLLVLLTLLAMATAASAQAPRGYYDQYGRYHEYDQNDGYYDRNGQWHPYDTQNGGYYDRNGQWHPNDTRGGYYDRNGQWHAYSDDRYGRIGGPDRWTYSDNRGRAESLVNAARNFALTANAVDREAANRSRYRDRAALDSLRRLSERAQELARVVATGRGDVAGSAYASLVDSYLDANQRFAALEPDAKLANQFQVLSSALGRLDKRFFGNRAFGGQNPASVGYGYDRSYDDSRYDRYGNPLPRSGRDTRPYPN